MGRALGKAFGARLGHGAVCALPNNCVLRQQLHVAPEHTIIMHNVAKPFHRPAARSAQCMLFMLPLRSPLPSLTWWPTQSSWAALSQPGELPMERAAPMLPAVLPFEPEPVEPERPEPGPPDLEASELEPPAPEPPELAPS